MELSIGQVAKQSGVSARMLRHYDEIGLFRPARVSGNGYRWYDRASLPRLFRIIALRRSGLGLTRIAEVLADDVDEAETLSQHLVELRAQHRRLGALIAGIEGEVARLHDARVDDPAAFKDAFEHDRGEFARRVAERFGTASRAAFTEVDDDVLTVGDMEHMTAQYALLLDRLAALMTSGHEPDTPQAHDLVAEHYAAIAQHWKPEPDAYRALGRLYVTDHLQRSIVARAHPDLPEWLADAIDAYVTREDQCHRAGQSGEPTRN